MTSGGKREVAEQVAPLFQFPGVSGVSWSMIISYSFGGLIVTAIAFAAHYKMGAGSSSEENEEEGFSEVVRTRRASLADFKRRSSVIYSPDEEAAFLEADRRRAKAKAAEYKKHVDTTLVTWKYEKLITAANDSAIRAVVEDVLGDDWSTMGANGISVSNNGDVEQIRCSKKCDIVSRKLVSYLEEKVCLAGHEGSVYRTHDIATLDLPIKAPVLTPAEVPDPHVVAIGKGTIRRFKCQEKGFMGKKRDYLVITVTYQLPSTADGDGVYVVLTTSLPEEQVMNLTEDPDEARHSSLDHGEHRDSVPLGEQIPQKELVFDDDTTAKPPASPARMGVKGGSTPGKSPIRLLHKDDKDLKSKVGGKSGAARGEIAFSSFVIEANDSQESCNVHFACAAPLGGSSTDVKINAIDTLFDEITSKYIDVSALAGDECGRAKDNLGALVRTISGEVASQQKKKTVEEIREEQRAKDLAAREAKFEGGPHLEDFQEEGIKTGYTAILRLHDYLDLPRDYLAEASFLHSCPPSVKMPRRRRLSVMQMVGLEAIPDTPETVIFNHPERTVPKLDFKLQAQQNNVACYNAEVPGSEWKSVKACTIIKATKKELVNLLQNDARISEFDDMLDNFSLVTKITPFSQIRHMRFKPVWPTSGRDFLPCSNYEGDLFDLEPIMLASTSAPDHLADPNEWPSLVRGKIIVNGYLIEPYECISQLAAKETLDLCKMSPGEFGPGHVRVTFLNHVDLGGQLPASVINNLAVNAPIKLLRALETVIIGDRTKKK